MTGPLREFTTAAKEAATPEGDDDGMGFNVDGVMCRCFRPGDGQLAVLMATTSSYNSQSEQIAGIINFFASVLDDGSHNYIVTRLLDRKDRFGISEVQDIMEWMIEEWTGRPTNSPFVSTSSPPSTGRSSTRSTPALT